MPIKYKFDILEALGKAGYSTYRLRKDCVLGQRTIQSLREGKPISFDVLSTICSLLCCQPGDILEHCPEESSQAE